MPSEDVFRFGPFELDVPGRELRRDGRPLEIEPRAFDLLLLLVRHRDRVLEKTELLDTLWGEAVYEASLTTCVGRLRSVLGDHAHLIRTEYGRGYRFAPEDAPEPGESGSAPATEDGDTSAAAVLFDDAAVHAAAVTAPVLEPHLRGAALSGLEPMLDEVLQAAGAAEARCAFDEAARRYGEALSLRQLLGDSAPAGTLHLLLALTRTQWCAGLLDDARDSARRATNLARELGDLRAAAEAALARNILIASQGAHEADYVQMLEAALAALVPGRDDALRARLLGRLAWTRSYSRLRGTDRAPLARQALELARQVGDPHAELRVLCDVRAATGDPDDAAERRRLDEAILTLATAQHDREMLGLGHFYRAWDLGEAGAMTEADRDMATYGAIALERNDPVGRSREHGWRAMRALLAGEWSEAERLGRETFAMASELDARLAAMNFATHAFTMQVMLGRPAGLDVQIQALLGEYPLLQLPRGALAYVLLRQGRLDEAAQVAEQVIALGADKLFRDGTTLPTLTFVAMVFAEVGDHRRCGELYSTLLPYRTQPAMLGSTAAVYYGPVARPLAALAEALGRWRDADAHLDAALASCEQVGARPWRAELRWDGARALLRRGGRVDAARLEALRRGAHDDAHALGLDDLLARVEALG